MIEIFRRAHAKGGKVLNDFKFGVFIGRFQSGSDRVNRVFVSALGSRETGCTQVPIITNHFYIQTKLSKELHDAPTGPASS